MIFIDFDELWKMKKFFLIDLKKKLKFILTPKDKKKNTRQNKQNKKNETMKNWLKTYDYSSDLQRIQI